jgi:Tfp pilus assembly protein PilO
MEMNSLIDVLLGLVVVGAGWWINNMSTELKRLEILLNRTREDYATKMELRDDMNRVIEALHRVEDKLDKVLSRD